MSHGLAEVGGDTIYDNVDEKVACDLGVDIESINIVPVFLHTTCVLAITDLGKSLVWLVMVDIVFSNGILILFPSIEPELVGFPPCQGISFCTLADISHPLYLVAGLCDGEVILHLKDPSF